MGDLWSIPLVHGTEHLRGPERRYLHPTQKPEERLRRIILATSNEVEVVLDPSPGSGTTTYSTNAAHYIGGICRRLLLHLTLPAIYEPDWL